MTIANVIDVIARLPDCDGQAADAISAYTQVKLEDAQTLLKKSRIRVSTHMDTSSTTQVAQCMFVHRKQESFAVSIRGCIKMACKSRIWLPCGRS